ncbi:ABC transporter permease [Candidatus Lucifugimonas marina]|uniref:ABC transporter permease n=1 Tax=Candidatus Lucifugimonas marina TaxID=3038979 RepID=A0AAJ6CVL8_9CHLR|nr:ABC transporter permease [SAR202 cluster bacterium JH702]MDG0870238.1 ABC transporter permease [SAR202 cluster bacterium JH639]WFG36199.1 ABC transporter permease [SAR202 cluster bacterium JH545]WFG40145.1 ABC transporter permease [SAR202 cluster bacterium JH1073]
MRGHRALVSARFRALLQYRSAALAGLGTQLFWGLIRVMIFEAFFVSSVMSQPMELGDVITYIWLGHAFLVVLPWNVDRELQTMVRSGGVTYELLRPMNLYNAWFSRAIALRTAPAMLRAVPLLTIAALFLDLQAPESPEAGLAFVISMIGAVILSAAITNLLNVALVWVTSGERLTYLAPPFVVLFSGNIVPIPFFPDWAQTAIRLMPFSGIVDSPFRLYVGHIPPSELGFVLAHQLIWSAIFIVVGKRMLAQGLRRMEVQGG